MKKQLLMALAMLVGVAMQAQVTTFPWTEGFENGQGDWTFVDQDGDGHNWGIQTSTFYAHGGSKNLQSHSYLNDQALTPNNYAFSPAITLPNETGFVLEYYVATFNSYYPAEHMSVYVATDNTVASLTDLIPIEEFTMTGTNTTSNYAHHVVGLNDYAGQTIYIVFRHHNCTDLDYILVDDVTIRQTTVPVISLSGPDAAMSGEEVVFAVALSEGATPTYTWSSTLAAAGQATISTNAAGDTATFTYSGGGTDIVTVTATNAYGSATASQTVVVTDCSSPMTLPWIATLTNDEGVQCWNFVDNDNNNYNWNLGGNGSNSYLTSRGADDWAVTPPIQMPANSNGVTLEWSVRGYNGCTYEVWVSPEGGFAVTDCTDSLFGESYTSNSFSSRSLDLSQYAGQEIRVAFRHTHAGSNNNQLRLRNIGVRQVGMPVVSIVGPASMELDSTYAFAVVVSEGSLQGISYSWSSQLAEDGAAVLNATDSTMTITYSAGGPDVISVTAINNIGSATATLPVYVVDCQTVTTLPWTEGFEVAAALQCWTLIDVNNDNRNWERVSSAAYAHTGMASMRSLSYDQGVISPDNIMISPAIALPPTGNFVLQYYVGAGSQNFPADHLSVYVVAANTQTAVDAATPVEDFTLTAADFYQNGLNQHTVDLTDYAGQTVYIAFRHNFSSGQDAVIIDDVSIHQTDAPTVNIVGETTANVDVDIVYSAVLLEGSTEGLTYEWSSTMAEAGQASFVDLGDSIRINYMFQGTDTIILTATNTYGSMADTMVVSVVDMSPVSEFPYVNGFEYTEENDRWQTAGGANAWAFGSSVSNGGSSAMYISNDGGTTYGYTAAGASTHAYACRVMNLSAAEYVVSYDWRCVGENYYGTVNDYMRVFLAPASFEPQGGTATAGVSASALPAGFIALDGGAALLGQDAWTTEVSTIDIAAAGTYKLVFYWRNDNSASDGVPAAIDNIVFNANTCPAPTGLSVVSTDASSVTVQWQAGGSETEWAVSANGQTDIVSDTPEYTVTGLEANTDYQITVRGICSAGDTSLAVSVVAHSGCAGNSCQFTIVMSDSYGDGWYSSGVVVMQAGEVVTTATIVHTGYTNYADTADISICAGEPITLLWAAMPSFDHECGFTVIDAMGEELYSIFDCSSFSDGDTIIVFDADCNADVIAPEPQPVPEPCHIPTGLHMVSATNTSVMVDWTAGGSENQWQLMVDENELVSVNAHPYVLGGLTAGTTYSVKVRALCSDTLSSDWSAAVSVSTSNGEEPGPQPQPGDSTGIDNVDIVNVVLCPNPATSVVTVNADGLHSVEVADITGRVVIRQEGLDGSTTLDVERLSRGVYFVRLRGEGYTAVRKLVVSE